MDGGVLSDAQLAEAMALAFPFDQLFVLSQVSRRYRHAVDRVMQSGRACRVRVTDVGCRVVGHSRQLLCAQPNSCSGHAMLCPDDADRLMPEQHARLLRWILSSLPLRDFRVQNDDGSAVVYNGAVQRVLLLVAGCAMWSDHCCCLSIRIQHKPGFLLNAQRHSTVSDICLVLEAARRQGHHRSGHISLSLSLHSAVKPGILEQLKSLSHETFDNVDMFEVILHT